MLALSFRSIGLLENAEPHFQDFGDEVVRHRAQGVEQSIEVLQTGGSDDGGPERVTLFRDFDVEVVRHRAQAVEQSTKRGRLRRNRGSESRLQSRATLGHHRSVETKETVHFPYENNAKDKWKIVKREGSSQSGNSDLKQQKRLSGTDTAQQFLNSNIKSCSAEANGRVSQVDSTLCSPRLF
ncbi:hypothetical protein VNO78_23116 [Psophocarpus tetragonolobus]|uniref:Uncharacterized protein n=1 Tax=Psophocarpus tetragonolobus TaxID=3891 RepID=A0AAN9XDF0_PSOTE